MSKTIFDLFADLTKPAWFEYAINDCASFDEKYQIRPEYQKKVLEKEIAQLKRNIQSLTDTLSSQTDKLKEKEEELKKL